MPRTQITNNQLLALRNDIIHQQKTSAAFFFFNKSRVERFFNLNQFALNILQKRMDEFVTKYVKHDENNQPSTEDKEGELHYVFATEEDKQKYTAALNNFLSIKTTIEI